MAVTLYYFHASLCSQKVRLALDEKGVSWTGKLVNIGPKMENYEPWYMRINPRGVVPTIDHDGHIVCDSARIVRYIDEKFDGPALTPSDAAEKSRMDEWIDAQDQVSVRELTYGSIGGVFGYVMRRISMPKRVRVLERRIKDHPDLAERYEARLRDVIAWNETITSGQAMDDIRAEVDGLLDRADERLEESKWLAGDAYSLADVTWTVFLARLKMLGYDDRWSDGRRPHVAAYYARVKARPSFNTADLVDVGPLAFMARMVKRKLLPGRPATAS